MAEQTPEEQIVDSILQIHPGPEDLSTIDANEIITPGSHVTVEEVPLFEQNIAQLATIKIDPELRLNPEKGPTTKSVLDSLHQNVVKATMFQTHQITNRYTPKKPIIPSLTLVTINITSPTMPKPQEIFVLLTGYEKDGCRNPNYVHRLLAQCKLHTMKNALLTDFQTAAKVNIDTCEIGYIIHDTLQKINVLNRYTRFMKATEWERQPLPKTVFQEDDTNTCYFHILFYMTFQSNVERPIMIHKSTETYDIEYSSQIIDLHRECAGHTYVTQLNFKKRNFRTLTPGDFTPAESHDDSANSPTHPPLEKRLKR